MDRDYPNRLHRLILFIFCLLMALHVAADETSMQKVTKHKNKSNVDFIQLPPGFFVERIYNVPRKTQGSWVALTVDPKGRLIASAQSKGLFRITPPPARSSEPSIVEKIDLPIGQAQGLVCAFGSLYVVVNGRAAEGSGLYKISDTDGDDHYDKVRLLRKLKGAGEHGPHGVVLAPDKNSLYVIGGNATDVPDFDINRPPQNWGTDSILETQNDSRGFGAHLKPPGGWVCRTDPEGKIWELLSIGLRNSYDLAVNKEGELFTFDSDNEWDMGMPWYRPTRVCHVRSGAEFGWRTGTGKWPDYRPDSLPPVIDVGHGSPTGITFGYGTHFPKKYRNALFIGDWSFGNIYTVQLTPQGGSYQGTVESFASAVPLPVTDLVVRPEDGMLYFTTGGRGIESALYRVGYQNPQLATQHAPSKTARLSLVQRRRLESLHQPAEADNVIEVLDEAWPFLSSPDRHVRYAARLVLEHQPYKRWKDRALNEQNSMALIQASIALCRSRSERDPQLQQRLHESLDTIKWPSLNSSEKIDLLRAYQLSIIRLGFPGEKIRSQLLRRLNPLYPARTTAINCELCSLLVALKSPVVVPRSLELIAAAKTQQEQIHYMLSLRVPGLKWTDQERQSYFEWFTRLHNYQAGESFDSFLAQIHKEASEHLTEAEKKKLGQLIRFNLDIAQIHPLKIQDATANSKRSFVKKWKVEDFETELAQKKENRNLVRGEALFSDIGCFRCHRIAGNGGILGPDLTTVGRRFTERDLLEAIIEPNRMISDQYRATIFTLSEGKIITGHIADMQKNKWSLITNMLQPRNYTPIDPHAIENMEPSPISMMPTGLLDTLTREEIFDLLGYLRAVHDRLQ